MEKYGFVYIWYDKWRKMYYIGCRWGNENDGYICSSNRMRDAYRRRPDDFKRRILVKIYTNRNELLEEEYKWLLKIKPEELGKKYYNIRQHKWNHWTTDPDKLLSVGQKISKANKGRKVWNKGISPSEKTKRKTSISVSKLMTPEYRKILSEKSSGWKHSEENLIKISNSSKNMWNNMSEEKKRMRSIKISNALKGRKKI